MIDRTDARRKRAPVLVAAAFAVGAIHAQPAPESLRVDPADDGVALSWGEGVGPYGVYRSTDKTAVVDPANWVGVTHRLEFVDPEALFPPGDLLFYRVDLTKSCNSAAECDNGNACDGDETCVAQACFPGAALRCNDGDACTVDTCDAGTGSCANAPVICDDGDPCTLDTCDTGFGCRASVDPAAGVGVAAEIAGRSLTEYPWFEFARAHRDDATVESAVDPNRRPSLVGQTCDLYVVEARSAAGWCADRGLVDARGAPDSPTIVAGSVRDNAFATVAPGQLSSDAAGGVGRGYDVVLDCDRDGQLDPDELVDGLGDDAGFYLLHDLTQPGPLATSQFDDLGPQPPHCGGAVSGNDDMRVYHPDTLLDPDFRGAYPLVVISHGNGHCYDWYDFLGHHLASYGFVVMSHDNDTTAGIEAASTTTLEFTDKILEQQHTLGGGVLNGHLDGSRIAWVGHSRGGEGIVRAYDRMVDGAYTPGYYGADDIALLTSIAPTDFLGPLETNPHDANFHLLYGSADGDVCGCPLSSYPFAIYERADGARHATYVHGADHNDFNCCGFNDFTGPPGTEIGRPEAQRVQKSALLASIEHFVEASRAAEDYFWRQTESFPPAGVAASTVQVRDYRKRAADRLFVIDDYQTETSPVVSSSGGTVTFDVLELAEELMRDADGTFAWAGGAEAMNGMTRAAPSDAARGAVFGYAGGTDFELRFDVVPAQQDWSDAAFLSFRAAQATRHPATIAFLGDQTFVVELEDTVGATSAISVGAYGGGIEEPYARDGEGAGEGWQNEFEVVRIRLEDFLADGSGLDLTRIRFVRFAFGPGAGTAEGRLGLDDLELNRE